MRRFPMHSFSFYDITVKEHMPLRSIMIVPKVSFRTLTYAFRLLAPVSTSSATKMCLGYMIVA